MSKKTITMVVEFVVSIPDHYSPEEISGMFLDLNKDNVGILRKVDTHFRTIGAAKVEDYATVTIMDLT